MSNQLPRKRLRPPGWSKTIQGRYSAAVKKQPFLFFGLPFLASIVGGSFALTPVTALRYEAHDRRTRQLTKDEELGLGKDRRRVNAKDEYYRLAGKVSRAFAATLGGKANGSCTRIWMIGRTDAWRG